ncbi:MAG TPA: c-type cytochrome [Verrucomicrobiae bacterium]|jgi:putative heme-binding domain-containing protein
MNRLKLICVLPLALALLAFPAPAQTDEALPALTQLLGASDDPQFQLDLLKGMSDGLKGRRGVTMPAGWEDVSAKLARSPNPQVRELTQSLSLTFGSASALAALRATLLDAGAEAKARQSALEALLAAKDPTLATSLHRLLKDKAVRGAALRGLAAYEDAKTPAAVLEVYDSLTVTEKRDALSTLVSRTAFARPMLAALADNKISKRDLSADIVRQLRNLKDPALNQQVEKLWGVTRESDADKLKEIARYKALLASGPAGDASRGRGLFARTCQQCHTLFDVGGKVGPDITGSNRADLDYILQNVLDPNAVIPNDYRTSTLETKDDRLITGIVTRQDDNAVTIVTANENLLIPRGEVKSLTQGEVSMMPEGLLQALTEGEVRDLIAYLRSPAQVPLPPESKP